MDWSNVDLLESLPEEDRARMSAIVDQLQTRDAFFSKKIHSDSEQYSLRLYNCLYRGAFRIVLTASGANH